jgi:hypothetical protein
LFVEHEPHNQQGTSPLNKGERFKVTMLKKLGPHDAGFFKENKWMMEQCTLLTAMLAKA